MKVSTSKVPDEEFKPFVLNLAIEYLEEAVTLFTLFNHKGICHALDAYAEIDSAAINAGIAKGWARVAEGDGMGTYADGLRKCLAKYNE